ncbi:MAG: carboxypeptidase-like regulatory domain-containing protein [Odoribacter sp.]
MMKFLILFLCIFSFQLSANVYSQIAKVSLEVKNASLEQVIQLLEKESDYIFLYEDAQIEQVQGLELNFKDEDLKVVLDECLQNSGLTYKLMNHTIVISRKNVNDQVHMTPTRLLLQGIVKDADGHVLPGVTVVLKETTLGVATDVEGRFAIELPKADSVVSVFSFIGMQTKEVKWRGEKELIVVLEESVAEMDEVVVTGIYERKSESFTGSATTFKSEELKRIGGQNVLQSLKTLDPSFTITESRDYGSDPNRLPDIEIRGKSSVIGLKEQFGTDPNQPLFILDGFETDLKTVVDLNMDRVASVTILKDAASTAIYGSKAANGIVVIETKKPEPGKFRVTYSGNMYVSIPDLSDYNLMNAAEKLEFEKKAGRYDAQYHDNDEQLFLDSLYNLNMAEVARGVNTYWMSEPLRTAITHKHNLYAEGGNEAVRYGLGFTYNKTNGVMKQSSNDLAGANFDLTYRKGQFLLSNKMSYDYYQQEDPIVSFTEFAKANPYYRKGTGGGEVERYLANIQYSGNSLKVENPLYNYSLNSFNKKTVLLFNNKLNMEFKDSI